MSRYQVAYDADNKEALIQPYGASTVSGHDNIGNFYHDGGGTDVLGADADGHVLFHHVQELLYQEGEQNMQSVDIVFHHVTAIDASVADAAMNTTSDTTEQITTTFTPSNASCQDLLYSSSNEAKATVSATGLITTHATGSVTITVTSVDGGFTDTVAITIS